MNAMLQDEWEIERVLQKYCRAMDRIDPELGYSVWHGEGTADYGPLFYQGSGRGFIDWVCDFHRNLTATSHQIANVVIDVAGDRAKSEAYVTVALLIPEGDRHVVMTGRGRYLDKWAKIDGIWAIEARQYIHDFHTIQDADVTLGSGVRDRSDPSYQFLDILAG